jgi:hypothetical protein
LQLLICVNGIISSEQRTPLSVNFIYVPLSCQPAERDGAFDTGAESSLCLPECSGIEIRDTANAEDDGLAIDDKKLLPVLQRSLNDPGTRFVQSHPPRVISRTRSPLRSTRTR